VKPVYIENGQGMFYPCSSGSGRQKHAELTFFQHTIFVGDGALKNSTTMVGVPTIRGKASHHSTICASSPDVETEHSLMQMGRQRNSAPIAIDCMFLWVVTASKLLLIQRTTNSAAVQRGLADVCLLCVALRDLSDKVLNQLFSIKLQGNANS